MKKRFFMIFMACLFLFSAAQANSWGAKGWTADVFHGDRIDYTVLVSSYTRSSDFAQLITTSRYHNELLCLQKEDKTRILAASTTAVYQPGHPQAKKAALRQTENGFVLEYPREWFRFQLEEGSYVLTEAYLSDEDTTVARQDEGYLFLTSYGRAELKTAPIALEDFNISLFPRMGDVEHLNHLRDALGEESPFCEQSPAVLKFTNAPVYSAPDKKSWRAAKGKASVSLKATDGYTVLGAADGWALIEYEVSLRTRRIGYVPKGYLSTEVNTEFTSIPAFTSRDTWITDDPHVSQYAQFNLKKGQAVTLLGYDSAFYAYAEITLKGQRMRGFIPMKDLMPADHPAYNGSAASVQWKQMTGMEGLWTIWAGGDMIPGYYTQLNSDGTFTSYADWDNEPYHTAKGGYWYVTPYDPASNASWADPPYLFTMIRHDGYVKQLGLNTSIVTKEDAKSFGAGYPAGGTILSLTDQEGGGGYIDAAPLLDKHGFINEPDREGFGHHG